MKTFSNINKLITGLNYMHGMHLVLNLTKFYQGDGLITLYQLKDCYKDEAGYHSELLFQTASQTYILLYLTDILSYFRDGTFNANVLPRYLSTIEKKGSRRQISEYLWDVYGK